jgi:hypothetical protein
LLLATWEAGDCDGARLTATFVPGGGFTLDTPDEGLYSGTYEALDAHRVRVSVPDPATFTVAVSGTTLTVMDIPNALVHLSPCRFRDHRARGAAGKTLSAELASQLAAPSGAPNFWAAAAPRRQGHHDGAIRRPTAADLRTFARATSW